MPAGLKPGERRGGRKKGVPNKRSVALREIADRALAEGVSPLDVMLTTMRDLWHDANAGPAPNLGRRMQAVAIAEKVAPYLHPKLTAVDMKAAVSVDPDKISDAQLAAIAASGGSGVAEAPDGPEEP